MFKRLKRGGSESPSFFLSSGSGDISNSLMSLEGATVLGINPPVYDFTWFDLWSKPAGLLSILQNLRRSGNNVHMIDCLYESQTTSTKSLDFGRRQTKRTLVDKPEPYRGIPRRYYRFGLGGAELRNRLAQCPKPDVILVTSAMTYWYKGVYEVIEAAKEIFPSAFVILGGAYARLCPEHARLSGADFVQTEQFSFPYETIALDLYDSPSYGILITSWGCPMACGYCASSKLWRTFTQRELDDVFKDLASQTAISTVTDIAFYDDALLLNKEQLFYPLCRHIREHYPSLRLHTPNGLHVAQMDDECCKTLFRTGFRTIRLSLEGTDEFTTQVSSGKTAAHGYERTVESLLQAGYSHENIETYVLVGLPGQSVEDVRRSIKTVIDLGGRPKLTDFSPIPGTPLFEAAQRLTPDIAKEPLLHNKTVYTSYIAKSVPPDELQNLKDMTRTPPCPAAIPLTRETQPPL